MSEQTSFGESHEGARIHYSNEDEDRFYKRVWAGDDLYIGVGWFEDESDTVYTACRRLVEKMAARVIHHGPNSRVLDLGAGYGAAARYLAQEKRYQVDCLNLSEFQNSQNEKLNQQAGLAGQIRVIPGQFEVLPFPSDHYDIVWSQDAIIHSPDKAQVFAEVNRVLKPGGDFIFVDVLQSPGGADDNFVQFIVNYFHLESLGSFDNYQLLASQYQWQVVEVRNLTDQLVTHYQRLIDQLTAQHDALLDDFSAENLANRKNRLQQWLLAGKEGNLEWGLFHFKSNNYA